MSPTKMSPATTLRLETLEDRLVCSISQVWNTSSYPYRAVSPITSWFDLNRNGRKDVGEFSRGTAVMISPTSALTSGHVAFKRGYNIYAREVTIQPGRSGTWTPYGTYSAKNWIIPTAYKGSGSSSVDLAVVNFSTAVGNRTGWFGYRADSDSSLRGAYLNNIGYPAEEYNRGSTLYQYQSYDAIQGASSNGYVGTLTYSRSRFATRDGSSGSPMYKYYSSTNQRYIVGIHQGSSWDKRTGFATRITGTMTQFIYSARNTGGWGGGSLYVNTGSYYRSLARANSANADDTSPTITPPTATTSSTSSADQAAAVQAAQNEARRLVAYTPQIASLADLGWRKASRWLISVI